jgi:hypothetical protein
MTTKPNGKTIVGAALTLMVFGTGAVIWEVRANNGAHAIIAIRASQSELNCTEQRATDRERIRAVESAVFRIDKNVDRIEKSVGGIRKAIERIDR